MVVIIVVVLKTFFNPVFRRFFSRHPSPLRILIAIPLWYGLMLLALHNLLFLTPFPEKDCHPCQPSLLSWYILFLAIVISSRTPPHLVFS